MSQDAVHAIAARMGEVRFEWGYDDYSLNVAKLAQKKNELLAKRHALRVEFDIQPKQHAMRCIFRDNEEWSPGFLYLVKAKEGARQ